MTMDRKHGWWVQSEIAITIKSIVTRIVEPVSTMQVQTHIVQSMQTRIRAVTVVFPRVCLSPST